MSLMKAIFVMMVSFLAWKRRQRFQSQYGLSARFWFP
jgi:hypothetical protein